MKRAALIQHDGSVRPVALPENADVDELALIQQYVGGYFEVINHDLPNLTALADEDGKQKGKSVNNLATALFGRYLAPDVIVGDVLVLGGTDGFGNMLGLTAEQIDIFLSPSGENILNALTEV